MVTFATSIGSAVAETECGSPSLIRRGKHRCEENQYYVSLWLGHWRPRTRIFWWIIMIVGKRSTSLTKHRRRKLWNKICRHSYVLSRFSSRSTLTEETSDFTQTIYKLLPTVVDQEFVILIVETANVSSITSVLTTHVPTSDTPGLGILTSLAFLNL